MEYYNRKITYGDIKQMTYREFHSLYYIAYKKKLKALSGGKTIDGSEDFEDAMEDMTNGV